MKTKAKAAPKCRKPKDRSLCERCRVEPADEPHPCPYGVEINDNDSPCTCCASCAHECAMDI